MNFLLPVHEWRGEYGEGDNGVIATRSLLAVDRGTCVFTTPDFSVLGLTSLQLDRRRSVDHAVIPKHRLSVN